MPLLLLTWKWVVGEFSSPAFVPAFEEKQASRIACVLRGTSDELGPLPVNDRFYFQVASMESELFQYSGARFEVYADCAGKSDTPLQRKSLAPCDSSTSVSLVRSWLTRCENTHPLCRRKEVTKLPTRVVDVGVSGVDRDVKLLETNGRAGRYLALSYCWGRGNVHRTTRSNFAASLISIKLSSLPKTLKDAVEYTRLLAFAGYGSTHCV